jgi:hypothetical protein
MARDVRRLALALLLVASSSLAAGTGADSQGSDDESVDFIRFGDAVYLSMGYLDEDIASISPVPLAPKHVGPVVSQIVTDWVDPEDLAADPNEPCTWDSPDGTASRLAPGDDVYAMRGYGTTFRLAARQGQAFVAYQVWCSNRAKVGADLFDIYDRVVRISVTGDTSESSGWAVIEDPTTVAGLVEMVLEGSVIPEEETSTAPVTHQLILYLDDGTAFRASAAPGELLWGLGAVEVPMAFTETLDRAWQQRLAGAT